MGNAVVRRIISAVVCGLALAAVAAPADAARSPHAEPVLELSAVQTAPDTIAIDFRVRNAGRSTAVGPVVVERVLPAGAELIGEPEGPWSCSGEPLRCIADQQQIPGDGMTERVFLNARIRGIRHATQLRWRPVVTTSAGAVPALPVVLHVIARAPVDLGPIARVDGYFEPSGRPRAGAHSTASLAVVNEGEKTIHSLAVRLRAVDGARVAGASGRGWSCSGLRCTYSGTMVRGDVAPPLAVEFSAPGKAVGMRSLVAAAIRADGSRAPAVLVADVAPHLGLNASAEPAALVEEAVQSSREVTLTALGNAGDDAALAYRWSQVCPRVGCAVKVAWQSPKTDPVARVLVPEHVGEVNLRFRVVADDGSARSTRDVVVRSIGDRGAPVAAPAPTTTRTRATGGPSTRFFSWGVRDLSIGILDGQGVRTSFGFPFMTYTGTWRLRGMAGPALQGSLKCFITSCSGDLQGTGAVPVLSSLGLTAYTTLKVDGSASTFTSIVNAPRGAVSPRVTLAGTVSSTGTVRATVTGTVPVGGATASFTRSALVREADGRITATPAGALAAPVVVGPLGLDAATFHWGADALHVTGSARPLVAPLVGQAAGPVTGTVRTLSDWSLDLARRPLAEPFDMGGSTVSELGLTARSATTGVGYDLHGRLDASPVSPSAGLVLEAAEGITSGTCAPDCGLHGTPRARILGRLLVRPRAAAQGGDLVVPIELHGAITSVDEPRRYSTAPFSVPLAAGLAMDGTVLTVEDAGHGGVPAMTGQLVSSAGTITGHATATFTADGFQLTTPLGDWALPGRHGTPIVVRDAALLLSSAPTAATVAGVDGAQATLPAYGGLLLGSLALPGWALAIAPSAEGTALAAPLVLDPGLAFAGPVAIGTGRVLAGGDGSASAVAAGAVLFDVRDALTANRVTPRLLTDASVRLPGSSDAMALQLIAHDGGSDTAAITTAVPGVLAAAGGIAEFAIRDAVVTGTVSAKTSTLVLSGVPTLPTATRTALRLKSTAPLRVSLPLDGTTTGYRVAFGAPDGPRVADVLGKGDILARGGNITLTAGGSGGPEAVLLDSELLGSPVQLSGLIDVAGGSATLNATRVSLRLGPAVFKSTKVAATTTSSRPDFNVAVDGWIEFLDESAQMVGTVVRNRNASGLAYAAHLRGTSPDASILAEPVPLVGAGNMNLDVTGVVEGNGFSVRTARMEFTSALKILGKTKVDMDFIVGFTRYGIVDTLLLRTGFESSFSYGRVSGNAEVGMDHFLPRGFFFGTIGLVGAPVQTWFGSLDGPLKVATIGLRRYSSYGRDLGIIDFRVTVDYKLSTRIGPGSFGASADGRATAEIDPRLCPWRIWAGGWCGWTGIGAELSIGINPWAVKVGVDLPHLGRQTISF